MHRLQAFITDCQLRGLSQRTWETYLVYCTPFIEVMDYVDQQSSLLTYLRDRYSSESTQRTAFTNIKVFIRWCARQDLCDDWITGIKFRFSETPQEPTLTVEEFGRILAVIPTTINGRRDHALLSTLFYTGARRQAIVQLRWEHVHLSEGWIRVWTKGRKQLILRLPKVAAQELNRWQLHCPSDEWVFPSTRAGVDCHVCPDQISHMLPRYAAQAGFTRRVYIHLLRHSFATNLAESGQPAEVIQGALGVSSIEIAQRYTRMSQRRIFAAVDQAFEDG